MSKRECHDLSQLLLANESEALPAQRCYTGDAGTAQQGQTMWTASTIPATLAAAFWQHVDRSGGPDACWPYRSEQASQNRAVRVRWGGELTVAHRVAFALAHGGIDPNRPVSQTVCHFRPCCNPAHLSQPTRGEVLPHGEAHRDSPFTEGQVRAILRRASAGETVRALAEEFGVTAKTMYDIVGRRNWRHLRDVPEMPPLSGNRQITRQQAQTIRERVARGERQAKVARDCDIAVSTVNRIVHGRIHRGAPNVQQSESRRPGHR